MGEYLKEQNPDIQIVAVEPAGSPVLSKRTPGAHKIQGIGAGFVPQTLNTEVTEVKSLRLRMKTHLKKGELLQHQKASWSAFLPEQH